MSEIVITDLPYNAQKFLDIQPGYCVVGNYYSGCIDVYTHDDIHMLLKVDNKYKEKNETTIYDTISDFLTDHNLVYMPVEIMEVPVHDMHGHPDSVYLASIKTPDGRWMLVTLDYEEDDENIKLYKAGDGEWKSNLPNTIFTHEEAMCKFLDIIDELQLLDR